MKRLLILTVVIPLFGVAPAQTAEPEKPAGEPAALAEGPQVALLLTTTGQKITVVLVALDSKRIRYKLNAAEKTSRTSTAKGGTIKAVQVASGAVFAVNPKTTAFESYDPTTNTFTASKTDPKEDKPATAEDEKRSGPKGGTEKIIAEGVGTSGDEALKDAFRNAVRQVVGAVVDADTLVKNDEVISDKVLTYSDGFIPTYKEISKKTEKGLVRIKISADVERRSVVAKLKAASVTIKNVDGGGLFAEAVTALEAEKNAKALVEKLFEDYPFKCLEAEVIGKPKLVKKDDEKATVQVSVRFQFNHKAYNVFAERAQNVFKKIARDRGEYSVLLKPDPTTDLYKSIGSTTKFWMGAMPKAFAEGRPEIRKGYVTVALNTRVSKLGDRSEWDYYLLDESIKEVLQRYANAIGSAKMSLLDTDDNVVVTDRFATQFPVAPPYSRGYIYVTLVTQIATDSASSPFMVGPQSKRDAGCRVFLTSPLLFAQNTGEVGYKPAHVVTREITLSLDELKSLQSIKCEVGFDLSRPSKDK